MVLYVQSYLLSRIYRGNKCHIFAGETIKIVIEDYVQHLSNYNFQLMFDPTILFGYPFQYQNRIMVEFNHLYHWHPLMPTTFNISGTDYNMKEYMFHSEIVFKHGLANIVDSMSRQRAGMVSFIITCISHYLVLRCVIPIMFFILK